MTRSRIRFIINPISGIGRQKVLPRLVERLLDKARFDVEISYTERPGHAKDLAREAANQGYDIVAVVGGDGSVNEAGAGLLGSETSMAIIPTGSGNGLARCLGIPLTLEQAVGVINNHEQRRIDTGLFHDRPFMGVAGIGFDALIAWEFSRFGKRGFASYFRIVLREYLKYRSEDYKVVMDGKEVQFKAFLLTAANSSQYGNRATIAPEARLDDGLLKVCLLRKFSLWHAPFVAFRLFNRSIHRSRFMTVLEGKEFFVEKEQTLAHIDGEPIHVDGKLRIQVQPASLNVIVPK